MDSLTQIVLGSTVTALAVPAHQRRPALVAGALLGTLPDLDVIVFKLMGASAITEVTWHRGPSHSLFVLALLGWVLWCLGRRYSPAVRDAPRRWLWAIQLALLTHPLLDAFTVYGTQLLWPLPMPPVVWGSIFIIDPLYTVPLLVGVVRAWMLSGDSSPRQLLSASTGRQGMSTGDMLAGARQHPCASWWLWAGLLLSTLYLGWSVHARDRADAAAGAQLAGMGLAQAPRLTIPQPFNTLNWRVIVMAPGAYHIGEWGMFDDAPMAFVRYPSDTDGLQAIAADPQVQRLLWFTHGFVGLRHEPDPDGSEALVLSDLRMGIEPDYFFQYRVANRHAGGPWRVQPEVTRWRD